MRSKDTALIERIKKYIEKVYEESGRTPSVREIATEVGCSYSTVSRYLTEMMSRGLIMREGGMYETEAIAKMNLETVPVAVVGSVSCGPLTFAEENIEEYIKLPTSLLGQGKFFILRASGQSMIGNPAVLYVDVKENETYRWDEGTRQYVCIGTDYRAIKIINGGNARQ